MNVVSLTLFLVLERSRTIVEEFSLSLTHYFSPTHSLLLSHTHKTNVSSSRTIVEALEKAAERVGVKVTVFNIYTICICPTVICFFYFLVCETDLYCYSFILFCFTLVYF